MGRKRFGAKQPQHAMDGDTTTLKKAHAAHGLPLSAGNMAKAGSNTASEEQAMSDTPIIPHDYLHGLNVVDIGDIRVARGMSRRPAKTCQHRRMVYDDNERRIWCSECESEVESFDAFLGIAKRMDAHIKSLNRRADAVKEAEAHAIRSRAAKVIDEAWRSKTMAPLCPHCNSAILPDDVANGVAMASKALVIAARKRSKGDE